MNIVVNNEDEDIPGFWALRLPVYLGQHVEGPSH